MGPTGRRVARALGLLLVLPAVGGGLLGLGLVAAGFTVETGASSSAGVGSSRPRQTAPIPIPARACPYLKAVQAASVPVGNASWHLIAGDPADRVQGGSDLSVKLAAFDLSLRVAATLVPAPVRLDLASVAGDVERGRALLRTTPNAGAFVDQAIQPLADGVLAFQNASDLVGNACGFRLSPTFVP